LPPKLRKTEKRLCFAYVSKRNSHYLPIKMAKIYFSNNFATMLFFYRGQYKKEKTRYIAVSSPICGEGGESRTHVRKHIHKAFSERIRLLFISGTLPSTGKRKRLPIL